MDKITMLITKPGCPLSLTARVVYSTLVYRGRFDKGMTRTGIAAAWRLNRTRDVGAAVRELDIYSLVARKGDRLFAQEPPAGWFSVKKKQHKKWQDGIAGFPLPLPGKECGLTLRHWVAYWLILNLTANGKPNSFRYEYIAKALASDGTTDGSDEADHRTRKYTCARSAVKKLVSIGLLRQSPKSKRRYKSSLWFRLEVVGQVPDSWLVTKRKQVEPTATASTLPASVTPTDFGTGTPRTPPATDDLPQPAWTHAILSKYREQGVHRDFLASLCELMVAADRLDDERLSRGIPPAQGWLRLYREAEAQNTTHPHSAYLFQHKLKEWLAGEAARVSEAEQTRLQAAARRAAYREEVIRTYSNARTTPLTKGAKGDDHIACMCSFRYRGIMDPPLDKWLDLYGESVIRDYLATRPFNPDEKFDRILPAHTVELELQALRASASADDLLRDELQDAARYLTSSGYDEYDGLVFTDESTIW